MHLMCKKKTKTKKPADSAPASIQWRNWRIGKGAAEPDVISGVWREQVRAPRRASTSDFHVKTDGQERTAAGNNTADGRVIESNRDCPIVTDRQA